jgi:electron transport complex protein RnfA
MRGMQLVLLLVCSGFSMNLVLQCGLGIKGAAESKDPPGISTLIKTGIIFFSVILLWFFFSKVVYSIIPGLFIYVLLFPASSLVYDVLEYLVFKYLYKAETQGECYVSFPGGITAVCVFICVNLANGFLEAAVLSFGFTAGIILVYLIIREVRKRAVLEVVPRFMRGKPLVLITMGMLSLVFSVVSILLFRMAGAQ